MFLLLCNETHAQQLVGQVTDWWTGQNLRNVTISIEDRTVSTLSDPKGNFVLPVRTREDYFPVTFWLEGYQSHEILLKVQEKDSSILVNVRLRPTVKSLHEGVVITAQRDERDPFQSPEAISSFTQQQFRQFIPHATPEALSGMTGVWMQRQQFAGGNVSMRGLSGNRNLILLDGIRLNNATYDTETHPYLNTIDPYALENIEVLRGHGSVQFGSDAMGGLIQAFSKTPGFSGQGWQVRGNANMRFMSQNLERGGRGEIELSNSWMAVHIGASLRDFGNLVAGNEIGEIRPSSYEENASDIKALFKLSPRHLLTFARQTHRQDDVNDTDQIVFGGYQLYRYAPRERELTYGRLTSHFSNRWFRKVQFTTSFQKATERSIRQRENEAIQWELQDDVGTWGSTVEIHSEPNLFWKAVSGVEYYRDRVNSSGSRTDLMTEMTRPVRGRFANGSLANNIGLYSLHTIDILKLRLSFGGRANAFLLRASDPTFGKQSINPNTFVGNVSALYPIHPNYHLTSSIYTGFRAPNLQDVSASGAFADGFVVPTDSLFSERSFTTEIGLKAKSDHFSGSLSLYRTQLRDLIEERPGTFLGSDTYEGQQVYKRINVGRAFVQGIEAELEVPVSSMLAFYGNLTYTYGQNLSENEPLSRVAPLNSRLGIHLRSKKGVWSRIEWRHAQVQDRLSSADMADPRILENGTPGWNVLNLHLGYDFHWGYATIGLKNVFDESYRIHGATLANLGRVLVMSVQVGF
ncbi:MAG: TonB-dependent receptor [Bacteroidota bacterium]